MIEDAPQFADKLLDTFGLNIYSRVRSLTRSPDELYIDYILSIADEDDAIVRKVKLADLHDNLDAGRLTRAAANGADVARLVRKYSRALCVLTEMHTEGHVDFPSCIEARDQIILSREKVIGFPQ